MYLKKIFKEFYKEIDNSPLVQLNSTKKLPKDSDVIVYLFAKEDWNGATHTMTSINYDKLTRRKNIKIIFKEFASLRDAYLFTEKIKRQNNKIKGLILSAHGSPTEIFTEESVEKTYNFKNNLLAKRKQAEKNLLFFCDMLDGPLNDRSKQFCTEEKK